MYNPEWFSDEFVPSVYGYFLKNSHDENGEEKPCFISQKQFTIISKNSTQVSDGIYHFNWEGLTLITQEKTSKQGKQYYTVNFKDNTVENFKKSGEYILNRLLELRDEINAPNISEYVHAYFDAIVALIRVTELDMENAGIDSHESHELNTLQNAKELNQYFVNTALAIKRFMQD